MIIAGILGLGASSCVHQETTPTASPIEQLLTSSRAELCQGVLATALREVRRPGYRWEVDELERTLRWSFGHNHDDCGDDVSGRQLWREAIEAWAEVDDEAAGRALVASLRVSRNLEGVTDLDAEGFEEETVAALEALHHSAPHHAATIHQLLRWYDDGAEDCSLAPYRVRVIAIVVASGEEGAFALAEHFPPPPPPPPPPAEEDAPPAQRCDAGWLLSEVLAQTTPTVRSRLLPQVTDPDIFGGDLDRMLRVVDRSQGELQDGLARRACALSEELARQSLADPDGDPRGPVMDTFAACSAVEGGPQRIIDLQRRLTRWLVANDQAEEAWTTLESLPEADLDDAWLAEIALAVIYERLERSEPLRAFDMYRQLVDRMGPDSGDVVVARDALHPALLATTRAHVEAGEGVEARATFAAATALYEPDEEVTRLGLEVTAAEAEARLDTDECPDEAVRERIDDELRAAGRLMRTTFRQDRELRSTLTSSARTWNRFSRLCRRRSR